MDPDPIDCQITNLDEQRLKRLERTIERTRIKLDVVGIRLDCLGRKLLKAELEKAELRRLLAERTWEFNLLRHRLKQGQPIRQTEAFREASLRASTMIE
ncbi:hypothetical protein CCR95_05755 [Thiocystis minor]|uniref:hypothetical protein n=1 Tax=Thiocystis minor TaxID=61597 RepID=UPI0019143927|nr:hypothetical protein [Thiocystis minor]MBK5963604.1 hypothetical protein [Thiocystis minor]